MKIILEMPNDDMTSGGVRRMLTIAMELPHSSMICGGIRDNLYIAERFDPQMQVRFQSLRLGYPVIHLDWTVGFPDNTFPECDACITYSDNTHINQLIALPQVKKVYLLMLSYGMAIQRERYNIHVPGVTVLCSSKKIEKEIIKEGVKVHRLGLGLDMSAFSNKGNKRKNYLAILYHDMLSKEYNVAVKVADILYANKVIDGVLTFGRKEGYGNFKHPKGLVKHYKDATSEQVCEVFNQCKVFLMPSTTEGISLTPIESTLCGCPAIICDGAIDEVFFKDKNCFIARKGDLTEMAKICTDVIENFDTYSEKFMQNMRETTKDMTWDKVITKLKDIIYAGQNL